MDFLHELNEAQRLAAATLDVPVCILAGAGSGKTRVVVHRIAHLLQDQGVKPENIVAVTFTNKAAAELRNRIDALVPGHGSTVVAGTFHGLAARILRRFGNLVGVAPSFVIYDADDADRLLVRILVDELQQNRDALKTARAFIDGWQCEGWWPDDVDRHMGEHQKLGPNTKIARDAYEKYVEKLRLMNALDFGSLLLKWRDLVVLPQGERLRQNVQHLLVDEYQDTNRVQAQIVKALAQSAKTVAVVGDDDQAIYGWRGADADNLQTFLKELPKAKLIRLEDNYRSTKNILDAANAVIAHNNSRLGKALRTSQASGGRIRVISGSGEDDEAQRVTGFIEQCIREYGVVPDDIAILYRVSAISRAFETELQRRRIPYKIVGGVSFYERREVKDALASLRCAANPLSDVDTIRALGAVPRGVGDSTIKKALDFAGQQRRPLLSVLADPVALRAINATTKAVQVCVPWARSLLGLGARIRPENAAWLYEIDDADREEKRQAALKADEEARIRDVAKTSKAAKATSLSLFAPSDPIPLTEIGLSAAERAASLKAEAKSDFVKSSDAKAASSLDKISTAPISASDAVRLAIELAGLRVATTTNNEEEQVERQANLDALIGAAQQFADESRKNGQGSDAVAFLENTALMSAVDEGERHKGSRVTLMTLHAAKGLEFDVVCLVGCEEHMFPHSRALADKAPPIFLEEERRLAYVGITRARKALITSFARTRLVEGKRQRRQVSRFLQEIPPSLLVGDAAMLWREDGPWSGRSRSLWGDEAHPAGPQPLSPLSPHRAAHTANLPRLPVVKTIPRPAEGPSLEYEPEFASGSNAFKPGMRVHHNAFGEGHVVGIRSTGSKGMILVRFTDQNAPRIILASFLKILDDEPQKPAKKDTVGGLYSAEDDAENADADTGDDGFVEERRIVYDE